MAGNGPPPKRDAQRRRRNEPAKGKAESVVVDPTKVRGPELTGRHSAAARRWYEALRRSGQSMFFEPSDWALADVVVIAIDAFVKAPSAAMLSAIDSASSKLLVAEGDRRRVRLELERAPTPAPGKDGASGSVSWLDAHRAQA